MIVIDYYVKNGQVITNYRIMARSANGLVKVLILISFLLLLYKTLLLITADVNQLFIKSELLS